MQNSDSGIDRISDLPNSLLIHITSLLNTKESVSTSILSKRWIKIWAFTSVLDFQSDQFYQPNIPLEDQNHTKFLQFIDGVFDNREPVYLEKFGLSFKGVKETELPRLYKILDRAAMCMPRVISIDICTAEDIDLPRSIFTCASIEEISFSLDAPDTFIAPQSMNLPSLKKLELTTLSIDDNFITTTLLGCPSLEELVLSCCILDIYEICSDKLKKLVLNMCVQLGEVHICCPAVVSLCIKHLRKGGIRFHSVSSLARADICFQDAVLDDSISKYLDLLSDLLNVSSLRLHITCLALQALLVANVPKWPGFRNLTTLELQPVDMKRDTDLLCCFLQQAPNLKQLILHVIAPSEDATDKELLGNYSFLQEYFETIVIRSKERPARITDIDFGCAYVDMKNGNRFTFGEAFFSSFRNFD